MAPAIALLVVFQVRIDRIAARERETLGYLIERIASSGGRSVSGARRSPMTTGGASRYPPV